MLNLLWSISRIVKMLFGYNGGPVEIDPQRYSDRRDVPKYTVAEVALYLHLNPRTVHTWFFGRSYKLKNKESKFWPPLAMPADHNPKSPALSFYNLAEAHVLSATRGFRIGMKAIREAMDNLNLIYPAPHPLISREFETDNRDIFIRVIENGEESIINLSSGNLGLKAVLDAYLRRIDRDVNGWPIRIYPLSKSIPDNKVIVIIPTVSSGRPTISGTGVKVETIWNRANSGESLEVLADDYGIDEIAIQQAINYFADLTAA